MDLHTLAQEIGQELTRRGMMLATAESCTGGWAAQVMTTLPGSSHWFECGFVTYTNLSKQRLLGVDAELLARHGAVSEPVARAMAQGALARSTAQVALAITGIAGPAGGSAEKPVGTVCFAWAGTDREIVSQTRLFTGDREAIRRLAVVASLEALLQFVRMDTMQR